MVIDNYGDGDNMVAGPSPLSEARSNLRDLYKQAASRLEKAHVAHDASQKRLAEAEREVKALSRAVDSLDPESDMREAVDTEYARPSAY